MAVRSGGFGGGLNPYGTGTIGGLGQYDIGADLADLEVYKTEVAWGNGLATDAEYLAALNKALGATDPNTHRRETAQNKLDDAVYRIGRSKVAGQLDDLIAFDQSSVAKMQPDNLRYRDIKNSLDSELAQRRSRDYGKLVVDHNAGKTSTATLLSWVNATLGAISPNDPDFDNWTSTKADLTDRVQGEKDSKVYQDFQMGRMKSDAFLSYLTTRRDSYAPTSPQFDDWTRRVEDATKQVKDQKQSQADATFFAAYEEGKHSDKQYIAYLHRRIGGMKADDPDRTSWQHRLNQAAFSLSEDKLRFDVQHRKQPLSRLVSFYRSYRATLNPGSAEWRTVTRALDSLGGAGGGGGGGRGRKRASGPPATKGLGAAAGGIVGGGKAISFATPEGALALMTINPHSNKKDQKAAKAFFDVNFTSLQNARQRGDSVFLFIDPRRPGGIVAARNPDGSPALGANGKPIMVRGSAFLPVTDDLFGRMNVLKANYHYQLAEIALANKNPKTYADELRRGLDASDAARLVASQHTQKTFDTFYQQAQDGIDSAMKRGDWATAVNLSNEMAKRLSTEITSNPNLDQTRRDRLDRLGTKLADNPLIPKVDAAGGQQTGGAIDLAGSTRDANGNFTGVSLNPGWHHILDDVEPNGSPKWGLKYDAVQDGSWEANHVHVTTSYGSSVVQGEVTRRLAGVNPTVFVGTPDGQIRVDQAAQFVSFTDQNGNVVKAYSLDGQHWIRSLSGTAPVVEVGTALTKAPDGSGLLDQNGNVVFKAKDVTNPDAGYQFVGDPASLRWYGQGARAAYSTAFAASSGRAKDDTAQFINGRFAGYRQPRLDLGAPGQSMQLLTTGSDGTLSFLSDHPAAAWGSRNAYGAGGTGAPGAHGHVPSARPGLPPVGLDLSPGAVANGILSFGLGLLGSQMPPPRPAPPPLKRPANLGSSDPSSIAGQAYTPPPLKRPANLGSSDPSSIAGRAYTPPPLKRRSSPVLPPPGKAKDDLVLPTRPPRRAPPRPISVGHRTAI